MPMKQITITPAPGYILGRMHDLGEMTTPHGIILPEKRNHAPILKVVADSGPPPGFEGDEWENSWLDFEEGDLVIIRSADQLVSFGGDRLYLVNYDDIIGRLEVEELE